MRSASRFIRWGPVYAALIEGRLLLPLIRPMCRLLETCGENCELPDQLIHLTCQKTERAVQPAPITVDLGYHRDAARLNGFFYYLYVILDVFRGFVVGWMIAYCEGSTLATRLIEQLPEAEISRGELTVRWLRCSVSLNGRVRIAIARLCVARNENLRGEHFCAWSYAVSTVEFELEQVHQQPPRGQDSASATADSSELLTEARFSARRDLWPAAFEAVNSCNPPAPSGNI